MALTPGWYYGYDVLMQMAFGVVCLLVSFMAFKVHSRISHKQVKYFGFAFLLISISYFTQAIINILIVYRINAAICYAMKVHSVLLFNSVGFFIHIILMLVGLATLCYATFRTESRNMLLLLVVISLVAVFLNSQKALLFFILSSVYLLVLSVYYLENFFHNRHLNTFMVAVAFCFLFIANIHFIISVNMEIFYTIAHLLTFLAYIFIIINFYLVLRK